MAELHSLLTAVHRQYAAIYADATARLAATGFVRALGGGIVAFTAEDLYKNVLQLSDNTEWVLIDESPITWAQVGGAGLGGPPSGAASGDLAGSYPSPTLKTNLKTTNLPFIIDGGGTTITTGLKGDLGPIDFACTINQVTLLADQSGSIVIDIWKDTYANYPPVVGDSITASAKPTISTATKSQDATLTGWTTSIAAGDILRFNVDSVSSIQRVTLMLKVTLT